MKYLVIGLTLLALLLGFCLWSGRSLNARFSDVITPLKQAIETAEQGDAAGARKLAAEAFDTWKNQYSSFAAYLDHNEIDTVTQSFASIEDLQEEDLLPSCKSLLFLLQSLAESDLLTFRNLL